MGESRRVENNDEEEIIRCLLSDLLDGLVVGENDGTKSTGSPSGSISPEEDALLAERRQKSNGQESANFYFDECRAFVDQVPECFDLGTVEVRLSCLTMSENYCAIGSQCGALFLFNRKIYKSVRPLRTSHQEIIICLEIYSSNNGREMLAVGHKSGTLIVLFLPTSHPQGTRKLKQSILEDIHRKASIQCIAWASDGSKVFSADANGLVVMTHVDFNNNEFISVNVCEERDVLYLRSVGHLLAIATECLYKLVNTSNNCVLVLQRHLVNTFAKISGIAFFGLPPDENLLLIMLNNGEILSQNLRLKREDDAGSYMDDLSNAVEFKNLLTMLDSAEKLDQTCLVNASPRKCLRESKCFNVDDFLLARVKAFAGAKILVYYSAQRILLCTMWSNATKNGIKNCRSRVEAFNLIELLDVSEMVGRNLQVLDVICQGDADFFELFILVNNHRVYRLSRLPAPPELTQSERERQQSSPSMGVLLNSLSSAAQKSSRNLLERFQVSGLSPSGGPGGVAGVGRLVDNFLLGSGGGAAARRSFDVTAVTSEATAVLATGAGAITGIGPISSTEETTSKTKTDPISTSEASHRIDKATAALNLSSLSSAAISSSPPTNASQNSSTSSSLADKLSAMNIDMESHLDSSEAAVNPASSSTANEFFFLGGFKPKNLRISDEYSSKITSNFQNIFDHLKNTNLLSDYDSSKNFKAKEDLFSEISSSVATGEVEELSQLDAENEPTVVNSRPGDNIVNVSRRKRTSKAKRHAAQHSSQLSAGFRTSTSKALVEEILLSQTAQSTNDEMTGTSRNTITSNTKVTRADLHKILDVIVLGESKPSTSFAVSEESESCSRPSEWLENRYDENLQGIYENAQKNEENPRGIEENSLQEDLQRIKANFLEIQKNFYGIETNSYGENLSGIKKNHYEIEVENLLRTQENLTAEIEEFRAESIGESTGRNSISDVAVSESMRSDKEERRRDYGEPKEGKKEVESIESPQRDQEKEVESTQQDQALQSQKTTIPKYFDEEEQILTDLIEGLKAASEDSDERLIREQQLDEMDETCALPDALFNSESDDESGEEHFEKPDESPASVESSKRMKIETIFSSLARTTTAAATIDTTSASASPPTATSSSTMSSQQLLHLNADYSLILKQLDVIDMDSVPPRPRRNLCDRWFLLPDAPFARVGSLSASAESVFICAEPGSSARSSSSIFSKSWWGGTSQKAEKLTPPRPQFLAFESRNLKQKEWQRVDCDADDERKTTAIAINDSGTIVWRVTAGLAYMRTYSASDGVGTSSASKWNVQSGEAEGAIQHVALSGQTAWYLSKRGVFVQMKLPEMGIFYRAECSLTLRELTASEHAVWALNAASGNLVVRTGLQYCPMGVDWVEDSGNNLKFVSIALHDRFGFGINDIGELWMNTNVTKNMPFGAGLWFKIESVGFFVNYLCEDPKMARPVGAPTNWRVRASSRGVFISLGAGGNDAAAVTTIMAALTPISGHLMLRTVPQRLAIYDCFAAISAGGFCGKSNENIYLVDKNTGREVFSYSITRSNFTSLPPIWRSVSTKSFAQPTTDSQNVTDRTIIDISASREFVYVVDDLGDCYVRSIPCAYLSPPRKATNASARQNKPDWIRLPRTDSMSRLVSVAASNVSLWAIDVDGRVYYAPLDARFHQIIAEANCCAVGAPRSLPCDDDANGESASAPTDLLAVEEYDLLPRTHRKINFWSIVPMFRDIDDSHPNRIRVSPQTGDYVWAYDTRANVFFIRGGVGVDCPRGNEWKRVSKSSTSMQLLELAVGEASVWALFRDVKTGSKRVYLQCGISRKRPVGSGWRRILDVEISHISTDAVEHRLWGLDSDGHLIRHEMKIFPPLDDDGASEEDPVDN